MRTLWIAALFACSTSEPPTFADGGGDGNNGDGNDGDGGGDVGGDTDPPEPNPPGILVINEVMSDNESTLQVEGIGVDWLELYNNGTEVIQLKDVRIGDDSGVVWEGGDGEVAPGGTYLLYADETKTPDHLPFLIAADGESLIVTVGFEVTDEVDVPALPSDVSWQRFPDGAATWAGTATPTAGAPNLEPSWSLDPKDIALSNATIHRIDWVISDVQYDILNSSSEEWAWVEATIDGIHYPQWDVRLKGSASFDLMDGKPQFKVDVNQYDDAARFREMKGFKLHNGNVLDPTRTRDYLSYQLARESGLMAPRVGWAELYVNGNYYGIYMMIEDYDGDMIEKAYPGEGEVGALFEPNESPSGGFGFGDFCDGDPEFDYEVGPAPIDPLVVEALNNASTICNRTASDENVLQLWDYVDKESFLTYMAWETLIQHGDGYKSPNNWRVYVGADYKVRLVPAGAEWTWDFAPSSWSFGGNLADWCLDNTGCKRDYALELLEMADRVETLDLHTQFLDLTAWLDPVIDLDTRSPHSDSTITSARESTNSRLLDNPGDVRNDVDDTFPGLYAKN